METGRNLVSSDGTNLAYWLTRVDGADNRLIVFLHGGASNHTRWSEFVEHTRLAESWNLLRPDLRGCGASMTRGPQNIAIWCRDLTEIMAAEGFSSAVIIGHSFGAQIAVSLAYASPDRVQALVLLDPAFQAGLAGRQAMVRRHRWFFAGLAAVARGLNVIGLYRRRLPYNDLEKMDGETRLALQSDESFEEIARRYSALGPILKYTPVANYLRQALATVSPMPPVSDIVVPVLVLLSGGTTLADLSVNESEAARFPNADVRILEANHWPLTETPDAVRDTIDDWVQRQFPV